MIRVLENLKQQVLEDSIGDDFDKAFLEGIDACIEALRAEL